MSEDRGVRLGNECLAFIKANETLRPLRDHIVVEPLPANPTIIIDTWRPIRGVVRAVGPGCYPKRYDGRKGQRTKSWDSKSFLPTEVKVGDTVELGGKEIKGYLHPTIRWGAKEMVVCREADVALIVG
jgi:hypothetical protein